MFLFKKTKRKERQWSNFAVVPSISPKIVSFYEKREEAVIRDIFITNDVIQRKNLRDTVEPERALSIGINMEMSQQNQQRIASNNNSGVNAILQFTRYWGANACKKQRNRNTFNREKNFLYWEYGRIWSATSVSFARQ